MEWPAKRDLYVLAALIDGCRLEVDHEGDVVLTGEIPGEALTFAGIVDALDELERRGWVEVTAAGPVATESGRYWLGRWAARERGGNCRRTPALRRVRA